MGRKEKQEKPCVQLVNKLMFIKFKIWLQAARVFSLTAAVIPVCLGAALAFKSGLNCAWFLFPLVLICSLLLQAATNLVSDYYDYINNVDKDYTFGSSKVIAQKLLTPKQVLFAGFISFALCAALALIMLYYRGLPLLIIGLIGILGGLFYSAKPIGYKYFALGDFAVFILMGPLMVLGSFLVITGKLSLTPILASAPVAFLVTAILAANNLRDIKHDSDAHVKTLAILLGRPLAAYYYCFLLIAAYASILLLVYLQILSPWTSLVFLTAPLALRNIKLALASRVDDPQKIATLDILTAQLHLTFGLILIIAMVFS